MSDADPKTAEPDDVKALNAMLAARGLGGVVRAVATGEPQGASDADDDDWVDDSDGRVDRSLVSLVAFQPGDDIFCEAPLLHTAAVECTPTGAVDVPQDWQRLLHHYIHLKTASEAGDKDAADALQALALLSTDGVTSSLAQKTDPERITYWRNAARNFLDRLRTKAKKAKKPRPPVTIDEIQRLMQVIETNCHSRDADDGGVDPLDALEALEGSDISEIEEEVGVYLAGSLSNHSCVPNAIVVLHPADDPDPSKASRLSLRCILPIAPEDPITISYTDESFLPMTHRQARLAIRGFKCSCRLCAGQDVVRGLVCSCGDLAVPEPSGKWSCQCGTTPDEKRIAKLDKMEAAYLDLNDEVSFLLERMEVH